MQTIKDIIRSFGSAASLAREIGRKPVTVRQWGNRNSIPDEHWDDVVRAAQSRRIKGVTLAALSRIASARRRSPTARASPPT